MTKKLIILSRCLLIIVNIQSFVERAMIEPRLKHKTKRKFRVKYQQKRSFREFDEQMEKELAAEAKSEAKGMFEFIQKNPQFEYER